MFDRGLLWLILLQWLVFLLLFWQSTLWILLEKVLLYNLSLNTILDVVWLELSRSMTNIIDRVCSNFYWSGREDFSVIALFWQKSYFFCELFIIFDHVNLSLSFFEIFQLSFFVIIDTVLSNNEILISMELFFKFQIFGIELSHFLHFIQFF